LVFFGVNVIGDRHQVELVTHGFAQHLQQSCLARADGPANAHAQGGQVFGAVFDVVQGRSHGGESGGETGVETDVKSSGRVMKIQQDETVRRPI
jgi:hypothetical protein